MKSEIASTGGKIIEICRRMLTHGWFAFADGGVSARLSDGTILIAPAGPRGDASANDLVLLTLGGQILRGKASEERHLHLEVYHQCPTARAVSHAHPPVAVALGGKKSHFNSFSPEALGAIGRIPLAAYARPGTQALGDAINAHLPHRRVMIVARHGALAWGEDLNESYNGMLQLERSGFTPPLDLRGNQGERTL